MSRLTKKDLESRLAVLNHYYQENGGTKMFNYMILKSRSQGYCVLKKCDGFWMQISKWYRYYGNLKRYCKEANEPAYYKITE